MQTVQRHFGKFMKRTADESQISMLLKNFEEADQLLTRIIDASKTWRDAWTSILASQHRLVHEFDALYAPIIGGVETYHGHQVVETPESILARTSRLRDEYEELKKDLTEEVNFVDSRMIRPAQEVKDSLQPMKKTIKKREDRKLDFERYQGRVDAARKRTKRSERENGALTKIESDLARATEEYNAADDGLRSCLPRLITIVFSLLPYILAAQIQIQNNLLAHYYTMLHTYCTEEKLPSPAPPMDEIIRAWEESFKQTQQQAEAIGILANGKAVKASMKQENGNITPSTNGFNRRPSGQSSLIRVPSVSPARHLPPSPSEIDTNIKPKISALQSPSAALFLSPVASTSSTELSSADYMTPSAHSPAAPRSDYFSRERQASSTSVTAAAAQMSAISGKKKPPPPPPRLPSNQGIWVTAIYDFGGQGEGDLDFKEGDRIKVVKKTESTDDWWQGELRGVRGNFPANYCE